MSATGWLKGRTAVVTGGTRGIGQAIALELGRQGAAVAICSSRRLTRARRRWSAQLSAMGVRHLAATCDVSKASDVEAFFAKVTLELGPVDILVNNAGIARDRPFLFLEEPDWDEVLGVNLTGAFLCSKAVIRGMMVRRWGRIINIVSASAHIGVQGQTSYSASKAGLVGFTRTLAREAAPHGVLVNAVAPGFIETDMTAGLDAKARARLLDRVTLGAIGTRLRTSRRSWRFSRRTWPATSPPRSSRLTAGCFERWRRDRCAGQ